MGFMGNFLNLTDKHKVEHDCAIEGSKYTFFKIFSECLSRAEFFYHTFTDLLQMNQSWVRLERICE